MAASNVNKVRALYGDLVPDTDGEYPLDGDGEYLLDEDTINLYLDITDNNVLRAAALAVRAISVNEVLLKSYLRTDDLTIDGVKGAAELRLMAKDFEARAQEQDNNEGSWGFDIAFPDEGCMCLPEAAAAPTCWGDSRCR